MLILSVSAIIIIFLIIWIIVQIKIIKGLNQFIKQLYHEKSYLEVEIMHQLNRHKQLEDFINQIYHKNKKAQC